MSVFTSVSRQQLIEHLRQYDVGEFIAYQGIAAGVENSNFFVTTSQGEFVLTLFESHSLEKLAFYLGLMEHLNAAGVPTVKPVHTRRQQTLLQLNDKPAALFERIQGAHPETVSAAHCKQIGAMLAHFHIAAKSYSHSMPNEFDHHWQFACADNLMPQLTENESTLLREELDFQSRFHEQLMSLPRGIIHGDLFRDNTLFTGKPNGQQKTTELSAILDLYTACNDSLAIDLAIVLNAWCFRDADEIDDGDMDNGEIDESLASALINAYQSVRPLQEAEKLFFNAALRAAALRFWILRLELKHKPRATYNDAPGNDYNPVEYQRILLKHRAEADRGGFMHALF